MPGEEAVAAPGRCRHGRCGEQELSRRAAQAQAMGHHPDDGQQIQPRNDGVAQQRPDGRAVDGDGRVRHQQVVSGNFHPPAGKQGDDRDALLAVGLQDACRGDHQAHKHRGDAQNAQVVGGGLRRLGHRRVQQV